jgi:hypothetical protein
VSNVDWTGDPKNSSGWISEVTGFDTHQCAFQLVGFQDGKVKGKRITVVALWCPCGRVVTTPELTVSMDWKP